MGQTFTKDVRCSVRISLIYITNNEALIERTYDDDEFYETTVNELNAAIESIIGGGVDTIEGEIDDTNYYATVEMHLPGSWYHSDATWGDAGGEPEENEVSSSEMDEIVACLYKQPGIIHGFILDDVIAEIVDTEDI